MKVEQAEFMEQYINGYYSLMSALCNRFMDEIMNI